MQQTLGAAKAYRPLHCANVVWAVRTHTQHCWGITQPPPGASDSQTGSSGRGRFPAALKILAGAREGGTRGEERVEKMLEVTYKLDLPRQAPESLPPEVQVNPLRVAVHHSRHLGTETQVPRCCGFHSESQKKKKKHTQIAFLSDEPFHEDNHSKV